MMLPEPALSISLPSINDNTTIECRVFHPHSLSPSPRAPPWRQNAAIIAHPYAPLGGCSDDHVVETLAETLLRLGFLVGTFNFRGAGGSAGRTSWTGKPEQSDYMTFAGFIAYYIHYLDPFRDGASPLKHEMSEESSSPVLLLAGYSYGAFITASLPPLGSILSHFKQPQTGSAAADVRLRAQHLAEKQNEVLGSARATASSQPKSPRKSAGGAHDLMVRVGGDEDGAHRNSHDSRRSVSMDADKIRREVGEFMDRVKRSGSRNRQRPERKPSDKASQMSGQDAAAEGSEKDTAASSCIPAVDLTNIRVAYLLVSPPQGTFKTLLSIFSRNPFAKKVKEPASPAVLAAEATATQGAAGTPNPDDKLTRNPSLVIYGSEDGLMPAKTQRQWTRSLATAPGSLFRAHEVSQAGHFWIEEGVLMTLQDAVKTFGEGLLQGTAWDGQVK